MQPTAVNWHFEAIGTKWNISIDNYMSTKMLSNMKQIITKRIQSFDQIYSRFRSDSLIAQIAHRAGTYTFTDDVLKLISSYRNLYDVSKGAVTPLIGQTLAEAGYDMAYSFKPKALHHPKQWDEVMKWEGNTVTTTEPILLDFGAAGKGYLVDIICMLMSDLGATRYYIDAGGDIRVAGIDEGFEVGLENPENEEEVIGIVTVKNGAICGSAGNRRSWAGYNHIIDPHSLESPKHILATWCLATDALSADGLATALYFVPAEELLKQFSFEYCVMASSGKVNCSKYFNDALFTASSIGKT